MQEQFDGLVKLAERYPQDVTFDDLLEVSTLPGKRKLLEKRKARKEDAAKNQGGQQQMAQQAMGLELADKAADVQEKQANTALIRAKTATEEHKPFLDAAKLEHEKSTATAPTPASAPRRWIRPTTNSQASRSSRNALPLRRPPKARRRGNSRAYRQRGGVTHDRPPLIGRSVPPT
jgi:hypothetical protein